MFYLLVFRVNHQPAGRPRGLRLDDSPLIKRRPAGGSTHSRSHVRSNVYQHFQHTRLKRRVNSHRQIDGCAGFPFTVFFQGCLHIREGTPWQINGALCVHALRKRSHALCDESYTGWFSREQLADRLEDVQQDTHRLCAAEPRLPPDAHGTLSLSR